MKKSERGFIRFVWVVSVLFLLSSVTNKKVAFDRWRDASDGVARKRGKEANQWAIAGKGKEFSTATENVLQLLLPSMFGWKEVVLNNKIRSCTIRKYPCFYLFRLQLFFNSDTALYFWTIWQMILKTLCALLAFVLELCGVYGDGEFKWHYGSV